MKSTFGDDELSVNAMVPGRWNWFISGNVCGKWIVCAGYTDMVVNADEIEGVLQFSADADPYATVKAKLKKHDIEALVISSTKGTPDCSLTGRLYADFVGGSERVTSIVLTDGFTVLGLAHGSLVNEPNLA